MAGMQKCIAEWVDRFGRLCHYVRMMKTTDTDADFSSEIQLFKNYDDATVGLHFLSYLADNMFGYPFSPSEIDVIKRFVRDVADVMISNED
jgi:hypothetical protein